MLTTRPFQGPPEGGGVFNIAYKPSGLGAFDTVMTRVKIELKIYIFVNTQRVTYIQV